MQSQQKPPRSSTGTAPKVTNITLSNVPYVNQFNSNKNATNGDLRERMYCGIASTLMVRAKEQIGGSSPYNSLHITDPCYVGLVKGD